MTNYHKDNIGTILKTFIKYQLIKFIYPYLLSYPNNFENLLGSAVGVYLKKTSVTDLDISLNKFYQGLNIDSLKEKIDYKREIKKLNQTTPKIDVLTYTNPCDKTVLNIFNLWKKRLPLLRFCRIRIDLLLLNKGQQIPPHAHKGVLSGFILLEGKVSIRHYHVKEYKDNGVICRKTVDKTLSIGDYTTNHDNKDNIHWLNGEAEQSILFRFNITGLQSEVPEYNNLGGRIYIDPREIKEINKLASFLNSKEAQLLNFNDN